MNLLRIGNSLAVAKALELLHHARADVSARARIERGNGGSDRCSGEMLEGEAVQPRKMNIHPLDTHFNVAETRACGKALQFLAGGHIARGAKASSGVFARELRERLSERTVIDADAPPHAERQAPAAAQYPPHLTQRECFVRKKLQALLAKNRVDAV